jgi:hypothetical protein
MMKVNPGITGLAAGFVFAMVGTVAVVVARPVFAQSPVPTPAVTDKSPTPESGRPLPVQESGTLTLDATLRVETSAAGASQDIPDGSKIQIVTGAGVCVEATMPSDAAKTLQATKELRLPSLVVPDRATARSVAGASEAACPATGERFTIVLALPSGSTLSLLTSVWSPGSASIELTVPAPQPQSEAPDVRPPASTPPRLPSTGGSSDPGGNMNGGVAMLLGVLGIVLWLVARVATSRSAKA